MMEKKTQELAEKITRLRETFRLQLPERLGYIVKAKEQLGLQPENSKALHELHKYAHNLAGSGGSFGYQLLSHQAHILEEYVNDISYEARAVTEIDLQYISAMIDQLTQLASYAPDDAPLLTKRPVTVDRGYETADEDNLIYIVEDDKIFAKNLAVQIAQFGYKVECYYSATDAAAAVDKRIPYAMIIDVGLPEGDTAGPDFVAQLDVLKDYSIPLFFMSVRNDWESRLACVRAGSTEYFTKPVDINALVDKLDALAGLSNEEPYCVVVVEDVDVLAEHYALVLRGAGHDVEVVTDVRQLYDKLTSKKAELILMDLYMPDCSGIEAAKLVRQIDEYVDVPIVFLSTESEIGEQLKAMKIGGDEFLHKPIRDEHLIAAVSIRANRFRNLRSLMTRDSLTGLINHVALNYELDREISRSKRDKNKLAFVMLDIDNFKGVNDQYGHQVGDKVLKSLSRTLMQRLRKSDVIARYGGEEFGIILPSAVESESLKLIDKIREDFSALLHYSEQGMFSVSFSAGIAYCPAYQTVEEIVRAADDCLYEAKRKGRNCVVSDQTVSRFTSDDE